MDGAILPGRLTLFVKRTLARWVSGRYWLPGCLLVAALLRALWVAVASPPPVSDFYSYYQLAVGLAHSLRYDSYPGIPTAYFPPGYPAVLALLFKLAGASLGVALGGNVLLQVAGVWLIYCVARELFASETVGRIAMLGLAVHPNSIVYTALIASENLFIPAMLLGTALLLWARRRSWLVVPAGLVFGLATLTRPQALLLPALCYLCLLPAARKDGKLRRWAMQCALAHLCLLAVVLPWVARNARVMHRPLLTTTTGWNLYIGNNPDANGGYVFTPRMQAEVPAALNELDKDDRCRLLGRRYIRAHPFAVLALLPRKLFALYVSEIDGMLWIRDSLRHPFPLSPERTVPLSLGRMVLLGAIGVLAELYYAGILVAFLLALGEVLRRVRRRQWTRELPLLGPLIILVFTALYLVYYGMPRYHLPMLPWMIITIAALATEARDAGSQLGEDACQIDHQSG